jgi:transitional endoplasmic reticulum ATPase
MRTKRRARVRASARRGRGVVLDEADSFLTDRRDALARWELTETNELLTQMEHLEGLFVCSTNLIDRLDRAALRRFAVKLRFDYLRADQSRSLVAAALHSFGVVENVQSASALSRAAALQCLTPGDVAAVVKRNQVLGYAPSAEDFVRALCEEIEIRGEGAARRIGFY